MPILPLLVLLTAAGEVIAAPVGGDQPPDEGGGLLLQMVLLLLAPLAAVVIFAPRLQRLAAAPARPRAFPPELGLVLALGMYLAGPLAWMALKSLLGADAAAGEDQAPAAMDEMVRQAAVVYAAQAIVALVYLSRLAGARRPDPDRRFPYARSALIGAVTLLLAWPIVNAVGWMAGLIVSWIRGIAPEAIAHDTLQLFLDSPADGWFILMALLVIVAAPVMEEVLYRGLLQETMRRVGFGPWAAIVLTSVLFAAMHWSNTTPHAVIALFVLSLGFGWVYERTGRLTAAIVMHALFNLGNLALALLTR